MADIERTYNVPLRKGFRNSSNYKKTPKAVRTLRAFLARHMKSDNIKLGAKLNELLWSCGIQNPPHHVKVKAVKSDGIVKVELEGFEYKEAVKPVKEKTVTEKLQDKIKGKSEQAKVEPAQPAETPAEPAQDAMVAAKPTVEQKPKAPAKKAAPKAKKSKK